MVKTTTLIIILALATISDLRYRRIPNYLTFGGMIVALVLNFYLHGIQGIEQSLYGLGFAFLLLFIPFALGGMGAGDVKLLMVVGAFNGPIITFNCFINGALVGGIYSLIIMIQHKRLLPFLNKIYFTLFFFTASAMKHRSLDVFDKEEQPLAIPYAVAITAGVIMSYWVRWL